MSDLNKIPIDQQDKQVYVIADFETHKKGDVIMVKARRYPYLIKDGLVVPSAKREVKEEKAVIETKEEKAVIETKEVKPRKPRAKK